MRMVFPMVLLGVWLSALAPPGWAGTSRLEAHVSLALQEVPSLSGRGQAELARGAVKFQAGEYMAAGMILSEAGRLGAGGPVEDLAEFLARESWARAASTPQDIQTAINSLQDYRRKFHKPARGTLALWRIGALYERMGFAYEAVASYEQALREGPAASPLLFFIRLDLANAYVSQGRYPEGAQQLRIVRERSPDDDSRAEATIGLGDISHTLRLEHHALDLYDQAETTWPAALQSRPASLLAMGETLLTLGDWARARRVLSMGYGLHPRDPKAPVMLARLADGHRTAGEYRQAKQLYETILERHPGTDAERLAWGGLGALAERTLRQGAAEGEVQAAYRTVLARWKTNPQSAEALLRLGQSYQRSGEFEAAGAAYDQLLARPDAAYWRPLARQGLEDTLRSLMEKGNALEVATLFLRHEVMLMAPAMKSATALAVGEALVRLGFADPAIRVYGAVLAEGQQGTPQQRALVGLAEAYRKKRDFPREEEAWTSYVRGFQNGRWSSEAQQGLIAVLVRQEKREEAEKFCRQWMAAGALLVKAAGAAAGTGGVAGSLACADLFFQKGQVQLAQGLYEGVLKAGADVPDLLWATYQIGRGYVSAGRPAQAAEFFRKVAKSDANPLLSAAAEAQLTALHISGKP